MNGFSDLLVKKRLIMKSEELEAQVKELTAAIAKTGCAGHAGGRH